MYLIQKFKGQERGKFYRNINGDGNPQIKLADIKFNPVGDIKKLNIPSYRPIYDSEYIPQIFEHIKQQTDDVNGVIYCITDLNPNWQTQELEQQKEAESKGICYPGNTVIRDIDIAIQPILISDAENSVLDKYSIEQLLEELKREELIVSGV
ncbi:hypothetical protein GQ473_03435 [archaeon]|nr:hypothetical protein [archaeon]